MANGTWAALVEDREEDGYHIGETREQAITEAMTRLLEDHVEPGWAEPGRYAVEVLSGCTWHERCDDGSCEFCTSDDSFEVWLEWREAVERVTVEVYATEHDEDGEPVDFDWREVTP